MTLVRGGGQCQCSREFYETVGELIGRLTHHYLLLLISLIGVRFNGLKLLARNLFQGGKATPNQGFRGEGSNQSRIDQQSHFIRQVLSAVALRVYLTLVGKCYRQSSAIADD
ncbi:hypothetical protein [Nostoc sp.]|uniref:hypothetical protein n=1 Tax=Nostoc sp. TaxID=1180 RepID=UPI002FFAE747